MTTRPGWSAMPLGLAFAMKQVATLMLMCDGRDIGLSVNAGEQTPGLPRTPSRTEGRGFSLGQGADGDTPRIFIYDSFPGGIGFSAPLFGMHHELLSRTHDLVAGCGCENGCPGCVGPVGQTGPLAKTVALRLLDHLLGRSAALPVGADEEMPF